MYQQQINATVHAASGLMQSKATSAVRMRMASDRDRDARSIAQWGRGEGREEAAAGRQRPGERKRPSAECCACLRSSWVMLCASLYFRHIVPFWWVFPLARVFVVVGCGVCVDLWVVWPRRARRG